MRRLCGVAAMMVALSAGPATAQSVYTGVQPPAVGALDSGGSSATAAGGVLGTAGRLQVASADQVAPVAPSSQGRLAVTGTDVMSLVVFGSGAIVLGSFLKRRARA